MNNHQLAAMFEETAKDKVTFQDNKDGNVTISVGGADFLSITKTSDSEVNVLAINDHGVAYPVGIAELSAVLEKALKALKTMPVSEED